jgi:hypothetical protein
VSEKAIQSDIMLRIGGRKDVRLFRNNVGEAKSADGRYIIYGLCPGSGDLIGWQTVTITPDMVGQRFARFLSVEVKGPRGAIRPDQQNWLEQVQAAGGIAIVARSADAVQDRLDITPP